MKKEILLQIDYRNQDEKIIRKPIDNCEFCVRDGMAYFESRGAKVCVPLEKIIQMYTL